MRSFRPSDVTADLYAFALSHGLGSSGGGVSGGGEGAAPSSFTAEERARRLTLAARLSLFKRMPRVRLESSASVTLTEADVQNTVLIAEIGDA